MVIRVLIARAKQGHGAELGPAARANLPMLRARDGLVAAHFGRQARDEGDEFVFVTVWRSMADLYAWIGPDLTRPWLFAGYEDSLAEHEVRLFETLDDVLPDEEAQASPGRGAMNR